MRVEGPATGSPRTLPEILAAYERVVIIKALQLNDGCRAKTARSLGIRRERLYARLRALRIDLDAVLEAIGRSRAPRGGAS